MGAQFDINDPRCAPDTFRETHTAPSSCTGGLPCSASECIVRYLREHGYDGLYSDECGCLTTDFSPCGCIDMDHCLAGYNDPEEAKRQDCDFWITSEKPNAELSGKESRREDG